MKKAISIAKKIRLDQKLALMDSVAHIQEYAKQVATQSLKDASENAKIIEVPFEHLPLGLKQKVVDKKSIINTEIKTP